MWCCAELSWAYYNRGKARRATGDHDRAIADYGEAIRLDPKKSLAYYNRGNVWSAKGDNDRAIADYGEAIRLDPGYAPAYNNRGLAWSAKGDNGRAIADYDEAIRLDPKSARAYFNRGIADLYTGALPKALADLNQASNLDPKNAYAALWLDIAGKRSNLPSGLADAGKQIDMTRWPAPVIDLFLGRLTPETVLAAADTADLKAKQGQICEANFYSGQLALQKADKDTAIRLFELAAADCPKDFTEWTAANAELKTLGIRP